MTITKLLAATMLIAVICAAAVSFAQAPDQPESASADAPVWQYSKWTNPMYGTEGDQFVLEGYYPKAPTAGGDQTVQNGASPVGKPRMTVRCMGGKFGSGEFHVGARVQPKLGAHSLKGRPQAEVTIRHNDSKHTSNDWWEYSNDQQTLLFDKIQLVDFLTGRLLGHPSQPGSLLWRQMVGVVEDGENMIVVQFDMPQDVRRLVQSCDLEYGKEKKNLKQ
jgi:hypothetical protein